MRFTTVSVRIVDNFLYCILKRKLKLFFFHIAMRINLFAESINLLFFCFLFSIAVRMQDFSFDFIITLNCFI